MMLKYTHMERRSFNSPIRVGLAQKKDYNVEVYLDTDANAYLMSKKYIGDDFSCIFKCTPKNPAMRRHFPSPHINKRIVLPNIKNMVIDPNGMPVGSSDILLPWTDMSEPHLIVEPSSFIPKATAASNNIANINFIVPKDVVMVYFDTITENDQLVNRPTIILTTKAHADTMVSMSGEKPEQLYELYMDGVTIKIDRTKVLEVDSNGTENSVKIVDIEEPYIFEPSEILTHYYS